MVFSRIWYVVLALAIAVSLAFVSVGVDAYEHRADAALKEGLASDSRVVEWTLRMDARRRLDGLLEGSADAALDRVLAGANALKEGKPPVSARVAARKTLTAIRDAIPEDARTDALFAVDRDGEVLAEVGYESVAGNEDFELGGYPAVRDALDGYLRDDVWVLGNKMYFVVVRPTRHDAGDAPPGALVGLTEVTREVVADLARRTHTSLALYSSAGGAAGGVGVEGFDPERLKVVGNDLHNVADATYGESGRSEVKMLADDLGVVYARLHGEAWGLGGGFAVVRVEPFVSGAFGLLAQRDDKAKIAWVSLSALAVVAALVGVFFTWVEQSVPLNEFVKQTTQLASGERQTLDAARLRGAFARVAEALNRALERGTPKTSPGGDAASKKPARTRLPSLASREPVAAEPRPPEPLPVLQRLTAKPAAPASTRKPRPSLAVAAPPSFASRAEAPPETLKKNEEDPPTALRSVPGAPPASVARTVRPPARSLDARDARAATAPEAPRVPDVRVPLENTAIRHAPPHVLEESRSDDASDTNILAASPALLAQLTGDDAESDTDSEKA